MRCNIEGCTKTDRTETDGKLRRGMCRAHYMKWKRGTLDLEGLQPTVDDGVRSPADLPVIPKAVIEGVGTPFSGDKGDLWAVLMPYPSLDNTQPCSSMGTYWFDGTVEDREMTGEERVQRLKACTSCPFQVACAEWATAHEEYGFWGGLTADQRIKRRTLRRQRLVAPQYAGMIGFTGRYSEREHEREIALQRAEGPVDEVEVDPWLHD